MGSKGRDVPFLLVGKFLNFLIFLNAFSLFKSILVINKIITRYIMLFLLIKRYGDCDEDEVCWGWGSRRRGVPFPWIGKFLNFGPS